MLSIGPLSVSPSTLASFAAICVGFTVYWANPTRSVNRTFFSGSLHSALWLLLRDAATIGGPKGQLLLRLAMGIGAFLPVHLWIIKETIAAAGTIRLRTILKDAWAWYVVCSIIAALTATNWFLPKQTSEEIIPPFGGGYYVHIVCLLFAYTVLGVQAYQQSRTLSGASRLELQIILLGGTGAALAFIALMVLGAALSTPWLGTAKTFIVLAFFCATAFSITTTRIFDARQLFQVALHYGALIASTTLLTLLLNEIFSVVLQVQTPLLWVSPLALIFTLWTHARLGRLFSLYSGESAVRQAAFALTQKETHYDRILREFQLLLANWAHCERAMILEGPKGSANGHGIFLEANSPILSALRYFRWATPERINRERKTSESFVLSKFMVEHRVGVMVIVEGAGLTTVVALDLSVSRLPYTYPQVSFLCELCTILAGALERAHFLARAQQGEQLATVGLLGASLAHEIRNPLVSIKTFVQLFPTHHSDPQFRSKFFRLLSDEVSRIDQLTEQLLDLSTPRVYVAKPSSLHHIVHATLDIISGKAKEKGISLVSELGASPDIVHTDSAAARQVLLNLFLNAVQAIDDANAQHRWIRCSTFNRTQRIELIVEDSGPGISDDMRSKLFQPFQTSKSKGFGLGLVICRDILTNLDASISVDPRCQGSGAVFRIIFPCLPQLS